MGEVFPAVLQDAWLESCGRETITVYFYSRTDRYAELSDVPPFGVELDAWWPAVENCFQARKFHDADCRHGIRKAAKAKDAKALGRTRTVRFRSDWEDVKDDIMLQTRPEPRPLLLETGEETQVENAPMESCWGCGPDGKGFNKLGLIPMRDRKELRSA